jgi:Secretion system C-terminal sorting domain
MKNIIIIIITIIIHQQCKAQMYQSIISNKAIWTSIDCFVIGTFETKTRRKEMMYGDTTFNNITYKKIYVDTNSTFNWASAKYVCAIREQNKKVYYIHGDTTTELLLYDFTKNVGDSVEIVSLGLNFPNAIKLQIDSISTTIINGVARKTYKFNANGNYHTDEYWYEGIGSSFGFLTPFLSVSDNVYTLKCNAKNDTLYYLQSNMANFLCSASEPFTSCEYLQNPSKIESKKQNTLKIYPNPTNDVLHLSGVLINGWYQIITMQGHVVAKGNITNNKIEVGFLKAGLYQLVLKKNKVMIREKFIKE